MRLDGLFSALYSSLITGASLWNRAVFIITVGVDNMHLVSGFDIIGWVFGNGFR